MPKSTINAIFLGKQRHAMADLGIRLMDGFRHDYMPTVKLWDALGMMLILHRMYELHRIGREASASALSRAIGMPRTTVQRKLAQLKKIGVIEQRGQRYLMAPEHLNHPMILHGFKRRVALVTSAQKRMVQSGN
jgi:biotin operon repressor